jgi:uncharacterized protein YoxC
MNLEPARMLLLQGAAIPDTIVTLTAPAELTLFDYTSGILQILVLLVGVFALGALGALALTLRKGVIALQSTAERLSGDVKPLLYQATRVSEEANAMVKTVRREVDRVAETTAEISERVRDLTDAASSRVTEVNALLDVLQDEVQDTALSAAANLRGVRVGAVALGAALARGSVAKDLPARRSSGPRIRGRHAETPLFDDEDALDEKMDDALADDEGDDDTEDERHRPYFDSPRRTPRS